MRAKLGIAPIAWTNDDLPELGGDTPLETCLREAKQAGFSGIENGGKFPKEAVPLRAVLEKHELQLVTGWYSGTVLDTEVAEEFERALPQLTLFRELGAACLVYGETAGTIQNVRSTPLSQRRRLDEGTLRDYGQRLTEFAERCHEFGVPLVFHHHMGTAIESEQDVDGLMSHTGEAVQLLFDTGHLVFAGCDPLAILAKHAHRIGHVHTKDVRGPILERIDRSSQSFLDAVLAGVFTVPGDGSLDFPTIVQRLAAAGYEGWFVVEAEQDPAKAPPDEYARIGYRALKAALQSADYKIER